MRARYRYILGRRKNYPESLELEIYAGPRCRIYYSTGLVIPAAMWNEKKERVKSKFPNADETNMFLDALVARLQKAEAKSLEDGVEWDKDLIKSTLRTDEDKAFTLDDAFARFVEPRITSRQVAESTGATLRAQFAMTKSIFAELWKPEPSFDKITPQDLGKIDSRISDRYSYKMGVVLRKFIKSMFREAYKQQIIRQNPYDHYDGGLAKCAVDEKKPFSERQLSELEKLDLSDDPQLESVRDRLLFSCYTGLRISDNLSLTRACIVVNGEEVILDKVSQKTKVRVVVPLHLLFNGKPREILLKYLDRGFETVFPPTNPKAVRRALKKIEDIVNFPFHFTFHTARHTCASLLADKSGSPYLIKNVLGHSDIQIGVKYVHNSYSTVANQIKDIKW